MRLSCLIALSLGVVLASVGGQNSPSVSPPYYLISVHADTYILPILPYELDELEPFIPRSTVEAHYEGHHENYRRKMNGILSLWRDEEPENGLSKEPILTIFKRIDEVTEEHRQNLKNNIGGFINHALYWGVISPNPNGTERFPTGLLLDEIEETFGSYLAFKVQFSHEAMELFGSGYVWLVRDRKQKSGKQLSIVSTKDQDSPISQDLDPILVIDVWEHAYYLKHQFRRTFYITEWWSLVDWDAVERLDRFWLRIRDQRRVEL